MSNDVQLHYFLNKQLNRLKLTSESLPTNLDAWKKLLQAISRFYLDTDQERYLLEQSMEISSNELQELNKKLENAQHIAQMGYWMYDKHTNQLAWSKETFNLLGLNPADGAPRLEKLMKMIHREDRQKVDFFINRAFNEGKDYEVELRIYDTNGKMHWHYAKGHPHIPENPNETTRYLSGIAMDVTDRKAIEEEMHKLQRQLIDTARQAGMAEVATSVLHNIGNILNSACVSLSIINETIQTPYVNKLNSISQIIKKNVADNNNFLLNDEKGKLIPDYLSKLSSKMSENNTSFINEVKNLNTHLNHIKDIVVMQRSLSGKSGSPEKIFLPEIIDHAIKMSCSSVEEKGIKIIKKYKKSFFMIVDKTKLLQILVNILRNAKESLIISSNTNKVITISVEKAKKDELKIIVNDTGVGISDDMMKKIFSFGYTTKKSGHGYGLHSSAITAKELDGELSASSHGLEQGATFTLTIPFKNEKIKGVSIHESA